VTACRVGCSGLMNGVTQSPPKLGGVPSRSEGGAVCSKSRSILLDIREAHRFIMSASRKSIRSALRANFEQTAPALASRGHPRLA
jgi:hypothetical protein